MYKIVEISLVEVSVFKNIIFICKAESLIHLKIWR